MVAAIKIERSRPLYLHLPFSAMTMDCPCYRTIYSAARQMPDVIIKLILNYGHTFSDLDFQRLYTPGTTIFQIAMDNSGIINCTLSADCAANIRMRSYIMGYFRLIDAQSRLIINLTYFPFNGKISSSGHYFTCPDGNTWESLQSIFGQDNKCCASQRCAIWELLKLPDAMLELFNQWCDTVLKFIGDHLYKNPHTLVCPSMANMTPKRIGDYLYKNPRTWIHFTNGQIQYSEITNATD